MINANTGVFDPRHMYGVTNQDVFRWPAIHQGVERQILGHFITTLLMPGIPLLLFGEEQLFYLLDNTAINYIFGRQPMSAATAWMQHGCYSFQIPSSQYFNMPIEKAKYGCHDLSQINDQRNPASATRNLLRHMVCFPRIHFRSPEKLSMSVVLILVVSITGQLPCAQRWHVSTAAI